MNGISANNNAAHVPGALSAWLAACSPIVPLFPSLTHPFATQILNFHFSHQPRYSSPPSTSKLPTISPLLPDYYAVLGVSPAASDAEITRAWRRIVLVSHPDKRERDVGSSTESGGSTPDGASRAGTPPGAAAASDTPDIRLINEARAVLSDPVRRAEFDAARAALPPPSTGPRLREQVSLDMFTPHPNEDDAERYILPCRCGNEYEITIDDLEDDVDVIGCRGCGEFIGVEYEAVEDDE